MKTGIHPEYMQTKVHCNGCDTKFETRSTVPEITVEICSNCHPFYTGKQKLVDTAGRVDKFKARQEAALKMRSSKSATKVEEDKMDELKDEMEENTVDMPEGEEAEGEEGEEEEKPEDDGEGSDEE